MLGCCVCQYCIRRKCGTGRSVDIDTLFDRRTGRMWVPKYLSKRQRAEQHTKQSGIQQRSRSTWVWAWSESSQDGIVSLRSPKLTKRLKSENLLAGSDLFIESEAPDEAAVIGGGESAARMLSPAVPPGRSDTRLLPGLVRFATCPGSISSDERNEVLSSSDFVLVIVRKESSRSFCAAFGVPLRSRIFWKFEKEASPMTRV